jgi:hypothetical protein
VEVRLKVFALMYIHMASVLLSLVRQLDFAEDDSTGRTDMRIFVDVDTALIP